MQGRELAVVGSVDKCAALKQQIHNFYMAQIGCLGEWNNGDVKMFVLSVSLQFVAIPNVRLCAPGGREHTP